jgi:hypothetical protein
MPNHFDTNLAMDEQLLANVLLGDDGAARILVSRLAPIIRCVAGRIAFATRKTEVFSAGYLLYELPSAVVASVVAHR